MDLHVWLGFVALRRSGSGAAAGRRGLGAAAKTASLAA